MCDGSRLQLPIDHVVNRLPALTREPVEGAFGTPFADKYYPRGGPAPRPRQLLPSVAAPMTPLSPKPLSPPLLPITPPPFLPPAPPSAPVERRR